MDKTLLITGASTGIGAATARQATEAGYKVALTARSTDKLEDLAAELGGPDVAIPITCDVTEWDQVEAAAAKTIEHFGQIDAVFANAGFGADRGFTEESPEHWKSMVLTNVYGLALTIRATLPHLLERGTGHFVITSSIAGRRSLPGSLYSATKFAATGIGQSLREEIHNMHDNHAIRVTLIEPGMVDTPFFDNKPEMRALDPDDVARATLYALTQPDHVDVNEILIRPTAQPI